MAVSKVLPGYMVDNWSEVCRSIELYRLQALVVSLQDALHSAAVWVLCIAVLQMKLNGSAFIHPCQCLVYKAFIAWFFSLKY